MWELQYTYDGVDDLRYFRDADELINWLRWELDLVDEGVLEDFRITLLKKEQ